MNTTPSTERRHDDNQHHRNDHRREFAQSDVILAHNDRPAKIVNLLPLRAGRIRVYVIGMHSNWSMVSPWPFGRLLPSDTVQRVIPAE